MKKISLSLITAAGLSVGGAVAHASAITGLGGAVFATGSEITVDILSSSSGFDNELDFFYGWTDGIDNTDKTAFGIDNQLGRFNLGSYAPGRELVFGITSPQGTFVLGPGSRNPDGLAHGWVRSTPTLAGFAESWVIGFEDLFGGGDRDYNDAVFRVSQLAPSVSVPEPSAWAVVALGLLGLGMTRRRTA